MSIIEHDIYSFWDWDSIFPGRTVGDAFAEAGAYVEYVDSNDLIVSGLPLQELLKIASKWNADYTGPYMTRDVPAENMKDITPDVENVACLAFQPSVLRR